MKKLYIILFLFFGLNLSYSQKTIYIYNFSSTNLDIGTIGTQHATSTYPIFVSNPSGGMITIPSNSTYILEASPASNTRFPFYSPSSSPEIDYWIRGTGAGIPTANLPSDLTATIYGATQILEYFKFQVGPRGTLGGTTLFPMFPYYSEFYLFGSTGNVSLDIIDANTGMPAPDGETFIIVTD